MGRPRDVWIWVQEPIDSSKLRIVDELIDATELNPRDDEQITRKANAKHAKYLWQSVPIRTPGMFVVRGQPRSERASRPIATKIPA
jgi:hypothetical protein